MGPFIVIWKKKNWKLSEKSLLTSVHPLSGPAVERSEVLAGAEIGTFQIHASQMTTRELVKALRQTDMDRDLVTRISRFQSLSDPFRYAPVTPDPARMTADLDQVRRLIRAVEKDRFPDIYSEMRITRRSPSLKK